MEWRPGWTTKVKIESGGRYPLGLNRYHDSIEELILKGVTVLARRLRHFSFAVWAIGDIERHANVDSYHAFVEQFQRRETAFSFGLYLNDFDYDPPGKDRLAAAYAVDISAYDCAFSVMQSNVLGTFGLYYLGTTFNLGLIERDEIGIYRLTASGRRLYEAYDRRLQQLAPAYTLRHRAARSVPVDVLLEWGQVNNYDNIRDPECRAERELYKQLWLRLGEVAQDHRRDTFVLLLLAIKIVAAHGVTLDEEMFAQIVYYGYFFDGDGALKRFEAPATLEPAQFYWRIYEGHTNFRGWLLLHFARFIDFIKPLPNGATSEAFGGSLNAVAINNAIGSLTGVEADWLDQPFALLRRSTPLAALNDVHAPHKLRIDAQQLSTSDVIARFLIVMVDLYLRFDTIRSDRRYLELRTMLNAHLWFDRLYKIERLDALSLRAFLDHVLRSWILNQHDQIMYDKGDLRRCWFVREEDRFIYHADPSTYWRPPKYETLISYLFDMDLIDDRAQPRLTAGGETFLQQMLARYYSS